jgi:hypothetical protein
MTDINITEEAGQDAQSLLANMSQAQFREFLVNSIRAANATSLSIEKEVFKEEDGSLRQSFTLKFR